MRIENGSIFSSPNRYKTYKYIRKDSETETETQKINEFMYYQNDNSHCPVIKANQAVVDNPDGSKEIYLTVPSIDRGQFFTRIKLADNFTDNHRKALEQTLLRNEA